MINREDVVGVGTGETARWCVEHGQGREITYEDALELLKKANADGLVHTIDPNVGVTNAQPKTDVISSS